MRFTLYTTGITAGIAALMFGCVSEPAHATSLLTQHDALSSLDLQSSPDASLAQLDLDAEGEGVFGSKRSDLYNANKALLEKLKKVETKWKTSYKRPK